MENNFKSIVLLLTTQAMINLGEITDPVTGKKNMNIQNASLFISLLKILETKTRGNLSKDEDYFLNESIKALDNLRKSK